MSAAHRQFVARCDSDVHKTAFDRLAVLRQNGELCDVALVPTDADGVEHEEIPAHKPVLAVSSPYFDAMFDARTQMQETNSNRVYIQMSRKILLAIVEFFYTGLLTIDADHIWDLVDAAAYFHLDLLKDKCGKFIAESLTVKNCFEMCDLADTYCLASLKQAAWKYACDNFRTLVKSKKFVDLSLDLLLKLISADELRVSREEHVYEAVMQWLRHDLAHRKPHLPRLLSETRFANMRARFVVETVQEEALVDETPEGRRVVRQAGKLTKGSSWSRLRAGYHPSTLLPWDVSGKAWTRLPRMVTGRKWHAAAAVHSKMFVVGGNDGADALATVEVLDTQGYHQGWTSAGALPHSLQAHALVTHDERLYAVGGVGDSTYTGVLIYDVACNKWTAGPEMLHLRRYGAAELDGCIYAAGSGRTDRGSGSAEMWDTRTGDWMELPSLLTARSQPCLAAVNGKVYVLGDSCAKGDVTMEYYDVRAGKWCVQAPPPEVKNMGCRLAVCGEELVASCGLEESDGKWSFSCATKVYRNGNWQACPGDQYRAYHALCCIDGTVVTTGGYQIVDGKTTTSADVFCLAIGVDD